MTDMLDYESDFETDEESLRMKLQEDFLQELKDTGLVKGLEKSKR